MQRMRASTSCCAATRTAVRYVSPAAFRFLTEADSPRRLARGPWRYHNMIGYTSAGAGTCIVDVRLNCPPEVTLHRLRRASPG